MITYSRLVFFLKLAFFLAALTILGVLFLITPPDKFGESVKVSTLGLEENTAYQILGAKLRGASDEGHRYDFTVDSIDPYKDNPENFSLINLNGTLSIFDKDIYNISAKRALVRSTEGHIDLIGDLNIKTRSGIEGKSQEIRITWNSSDLVVSNEVELTTPLGMIYGGSMKISNASLSNSTIPYVHLENGVRLVYQPVDESKAK